MPEQTSLQGVHHVAYRCKDAMQTVRWYEQHLGMKFVLAIAENQVPSTGAPDPYMHVFLDAGRAMCWPFSNCPSLPKWVATPIPQPGSNILHSRWTASKHCSRPKQDSKRLASRSSAPRTTRSFEASTSLTRMVIGSSWPGTAVPRTCTSDSIQSNGPCSRNGVAPAERPSMRPGCTTGRSVTEQEVTTRGTIPRV